MGALSGVGSGPEPGETMPRPTHAGAPKPCHKIKGCPLPMAPAEHVGMSLARQALRWLLRLLLINIR